MDEIQITNNKLPTTLEEKTKYVLFGTEALKAYRAKLAAMKKAGINNEQYEQLKLEAQETAENLLLFSADIGKEMQEIEKASGGDRRSENFKNDVNGNFEKSKPETIHEMGFTDRQARDFQTLAKHPDLIKKAMTEARENDRIVTRQNVLDMIVPPRTKAQTMREFKEQAEKSKPHVSFNSTDNEWYTPEVYIEAARKVMGSIDLDPASNEYANMTIKALKYFDTDNNGLVQKWFGNIWLNPPYSTALISQFADKLNESNFKQAIVLVNNATETEWFNKLVQKARAIVFHKGRIRYLKHDGEHGAPLQGQAFIYYGENPDKFINVFSEFGWGAML